MKIIINGFGGENHQQILRKIIFGLPLKYLVFTFVNFKPDLGTLNCQTLFLNWRDVNFLGKYPVDMNKLEPLDEALVDKMRKCETITLRMMDRLETYKKYSYAERKELYFKHLRFWNDLLKKEQIDLFLSQNIPHETSDYVCYCLCKAKNIPTLIFFQSHIPDTVFLIDNIETTDYGLPKKYLALKQKLKSKPLDEILLSPRFENYYLEQKNKRIDATPFYMHDFVFSKRILKRFFSVKNNIFKYRSAYLRKLPLMLQATLRAFLIHQQTASLMRFYEKNCYRGKLPKKFFFVALHFQPEMSTSPRADVYVNQLLVVQLLSFFVPKNITILVKEHPRQQVLARSKQYYRELMKLENVKLVSRSYPSNELVRKSLAVATCTGLVGFEALFQNKPVLMFGHDFYQNAPGVFSIHSSEDLKKAIEKILTSTVLSDKDFKIFLRATQEVSIQATVDTDYLPTTQLSSLENANNVFSAIKKKIHQND